MATSPTPTGTLTGNSSTGSLKKEKGWRGTLTRGRRKAEKEVNDLHDEGKHAIEDPSSPSTIFSPDSYQLEEGQERFMVEPNSLEDSKVKELCDALLDWINDELQDHRIVVKDITEDLYDGQILAIFVEKLAEINLGALTEVTQSVDLQKKNLSQLLEKVEELLKPLHGQPKWTMELIYTKHLPAILHLLVHLAKRYKCPFKLPQNVTINVVAVQKKDGILRSKTIPEDITGTLGDGEGKAERDAFDTLFDHAPEKLSVVKKSLQGFVNKHLSKLNLEVTDLDTQFHDGVYFILLMGLLESYFVPLHLFHLTPKGFEQKVHNVDFALDLLVDADLPRPKAKPSDIVNKDLKSTLRVLYALFTKYKNIK